MKGQQESVSAFVLTGFVKLQAAERRLGAGTCATELAA